MEIRHLRYFVAAAEEENFHRAAERLHIAQPALSRRIRDLEEDLGFDLFERNLKRVHLSLAGRAYLDNVKRALADLHRAGLDSARIAKGQAGLLALGFPESMVRYAGVPRSFREFRTSFPDVELRLNPMDPARGLDALLRGDIDAAFTFNARLDGLRHLPIGSETWLLALPAIHPLVHKEKLRLADLEGEPFIWTRRELSPVVYDGLIAACRAVGFVPNIIQSAGSESIKQHLVAAGMGLGFMLSTARAPVEDVVFRAVEDLNAVVRADFVWRHERSSAQLENFISLVRLCSEVPAGS
jgi:DNA-binding transcriptional LysR family regulator